MTEAAPEGSYVIRCRLCDRKLMGVSYPVVRFDPRRWVT